MSRLRWGKFYWSDWANDVALNRCSIPARGLWMALLCLAAQGKPYGHVTDATGKPPLRLALLALACPRDTEPRQFDRWLAELERNGVAKRTENGTLYSVRMVRDAARAEHAAKAGKARRSAANHSGTSYTKVAPILHQSCTSDARKIAETRGNGRSIVAGDDGIQNTDASLVSPKRKTRDASVTEDADAQRVVRLWGARAEPPRLPDAEDDPIASFLAIDRITP